MAYHVTSLRDPEGSSGDSPLLWALGSAPSAEQVPRDLEPCCGVVSHSCALLPGDC